MTTLNSLESCLLQTIFVRSLIKRPLVGSCQHITLVFSPVPLLEIVHSYYNYSNLSLNSSKHKKIKMSTIESLPNDMLRFLLRNYLKESDSLALALAGHSSFSEMFWSNR